MSVKDHLGREIRPGDYVGQRNINDQAKGASPVNAGRIGKVISAGRKRVNVKFHTDDGTRYIDGDYLVIMRYINGEWTGDFHPADEFTHADRKAADQADLSGFFRAAINDAELRMKAISAPESKPAEKLASVKAVDDWDGPGQHGVEFTVHTGWNSQARHTISEEVARELAAELQKHLDAR